ncbi:MAG: 50S ribosomal protein L21 [Candidatus Buchananbacteria bacterium CG10_big_fil_rev_8_21_14_0_10_42_9]|uniref:Large ribosomal subunit protein bL21 n=1 Tax=Candidatus Buchananbacteria bacterium CG10_big_fil_rev_8_21_14_0_10_42_9 TaxID=1974526 RepID=A0A2H0W1A9_9BACT|nr:MAG: 50S ribosomal protein L21 [Candidatus Buchananbacteria bacterium CG10_big_fil_rev_8_21_14_0_10_42_9]
MNLAVIKTGGKQYVVTPDSKLKIEKIAGDKGIEFETLLMADDKGDKVEIGQPSLGKKVKAKVLGQGRARKITVVKYKPKTRYKRTLGHRQHFTQVQIEKF